MKIARRCFVLCLLSLHTVIAHAGEYLPDWVYEVEHYTLPNGMKVTLKNTTMANNVSIRLEVGYGTEDESCGQRETAHFLEHLMFTGTREFDEATLEQMVADYGASWNAKTYIDGTVYEMDIYSGYLEEGLSLLQLILTDSTLTQENVDKSRDIIHRESGGERSAITRFFYNHGYMKGAVDFMIEDLDIAHCTQLEQADAITREQIVKAYDTWYVPNNMHLFLVGKIQDSNRDRQTHSLIAALFGELPPQAIPERMNKNWQTINQKEYRSVMSPLYADETVIGYWFPIPAFNQDFYYAGQILSAYLDERFFEAVRIDAGLSYSPEVLYSSDLYGGEFEFSIDVNNDDVAEGRAAMDKFLTEVVQQGMTQEDLDRIRTGILISQALYTPENSSLAAYYLSSSETFDQRSHYQNMEEHLRKVTVEDIEHFVSTYLHKKPVVWIEAPTLAVHTFWLLVIGFPVLIIAFIGFIFWRRKHH